MEIFGTNQKLPSFRSDGIGPRSFGNVYSVLEDGYCRVILCLGTLSVDHGFCQGSGNIRTTAALKRNGQVKEHGGF